MSSFKKAIKARRKTHKERSQPAARAKLGMLEKGKDWKKRRDDYHSKERRIKAMTSKVANRNEDEFYFGMIKTKTRDGVHIAERKSEGYSADEMRLLRTQDLGYINLRAQQEREQIEKLKSSMHLLIAAAGGDADADADDLAAFASDFDDDDLAGLDVAAAPPTGTTSSHVVFVGSKRKVETFDPVKHFDTAPELVGRAFNRPRVETLRNQTVHGPTDRKLQRKLRRKRELGFEELSQRIDRLKKLERIAAKMNQEKSLLGKGRRTKVRKAEDGNGPTVYKWKRQRNR